MPAKHSAFSRNLQHSGGVPALDFSRSIGAVIHLCIPLASYFVIYLGYGEKILSALGLQAFPLSPARAGLLLGLDTLYGIRWAIGCIIMLSGSSVSTSVSIGIMHMVIGALWVSLAAMQIPSLPENVTNLELLAAGMAVIAAVLQQGAELQRWLFKRDSSNAGKLHTTGLFGQAQFINHTGHVLHAVAAAALGRSWFLFFTFAYAVRMVVFQITPETIDHMKKKYGDAHKEYCQATPYLYLPGVY